LFVAITFPPFAICGATRVAELVIDDKEVEEEEVNAVDPDSWEDRELWLIVWFKLEPPLAALLVENTGAVFVLERGP
jgi:hypothetical protein